jgi:hypothetical protein
LLVGVVVRVRNRMNGQPVGMRGWLSRLAEAPRAGIVATPPYHQLVRHTGADGDVLLRLWLLGAFVGIAMGGDWWYHYLVQILAPFALWFAPVLLDLSDRLTKNWRLALIAATVVAFVLPYTVLGKGSAGEISYALFEHRGYPAQQEVANYIRGHTKSETAIFVAFDQAALYYLADRPSTYRYMYDQELRALPDAEEHLVQMVLSPYRPQYIVGTRQRAPFSDNGQAFWNAVSENYYLETMVRGVPIYRAKLPLTYQFIEPQ